MTGGIYAIRNTKNGDQYVGSSKNIEHRFDQHRACLKTKNHTAHLQRAWNKYGAKSFIFIVLEETEDLEVRERFYIEHHNSEYNLTTVTNGRWSRHESVCKRISRALKGKQPQLGRRWKMSDRGKENIRKAMLGKQNNLGGHWHHTDASKKKISDALKGKPKSQSQHDAVKSSWVKRRELKRM